MDLFTRRKPELGPPWAKPEPAFIWHPDDAIYYEQPRHGFCFFRREFTLDAAPVAAALRLLVDTRYVLWVNGRELGRGPARFDPRAAMYDPYDLTDLLRPGANVIGVYALHHGYGTGAQASILQCVYAQLTLSAADGGQTVINSDREWLALRSPVHARSVPRLNGRQGPMEVQDVAAWPTGWLDPGFAATGWRPAAAIRRGIVNGPYWNLAPRDIPHLAVSHRAAVSIRRLGWSADAMPADAALGAGRDVRRLLAEAPATGGACVWELDFGQITCGYLELDVSTEAPATLDAQYAEALVSGRILGGGNSRIFMDRWRLPAGRHTLRVYFGWKTFRFVQCWAWDAAAGVVLHGASIRSVGYPLPRRPLPDCEPASRLPAIVDLADRTLRLCMQDGFLDSASREQQQWMGDGERQAYAAWHFYGPAAQPLWRRMLRQIPQSQDWTGTMMPRHPGRHENVAPIPYFMLSWVTSLADYTRLTQDLAPLEELWPNLRHCLRWFTAYAEPAQGGLLVDVPFWMYIDWGNLPVGRMPDVNRGGVVTALNLKYLQALTQAATLADLLHDAAASAHYRKTAHTIAAGLRDRAWDGARGAFVDAVVGGERSPSISEVTNGLALAHLPGLTEAQTASIVAAVFESPAADVIWMSPAMVLELGQGLAAVGRADLALRLLCDRFGAMLDAGATAMWEMWQLTNGDPETDHIVSASHGWGAGILGFLAVGIAGVAIDWQGGLTVRPALDACARFGWQVATRHGDVTVDWRHDGVDGELRVGAPDGIVPQVGVSAPWQITATGDPGRWRLQRESKVKQ